jgi:hypothetical protein
MVFSGSSGMLSKGGEITWGALASASTTALVRGGEATMLERGGVEMSMSSGCARKKPVKSLDGATWSPNTDSVDIMLQSLLGSDGSSRSNTAAGILSGSAAVPALSNDGCRSISCVRGGEAAGQPSRSNDMADASEDDEEGW